jgi:peptidoglycan L-alanyl-D-glutamate endopeptidase CwlK
MLWQLTLYFFVAVLVMSLVFFPSARTSAFRQIDWLKRLVFLVSRKTANSSRSSLRTVVSKVRQVSLEAREFLLQRKKWVFLVSVAATVPSLAALTFSHWHVLEYEEESRSPDDHVAILLRGERLVPPAPLPPAVFITPEVELLRPKLGEASRDWNLLDADFRQRLLLVYKMMREQHGYEMVLIEGYRSPDRQAMLAQSGSGVITNADAYQSYHQYGLAADSAFFRDGRLIISEKDPWAMRGYQLYGELSQSVGLTWGGAWKLMDFGHVELKRAGTLGRKF